MGIINTEYMCKLGRKKSERQFAKDYLRKMDLQAHVIENGIVLPPGRGGAVKPNPYNPDRILIGRGGVLDGDGNYVEASSVRAVNVQDRMYGAYDISAHEIQDSDECVIYLNHFWQHWGHFILDFVGRLWYVLQCNENYKLVYTCRLGESEPIIGNYLEFIRLLGIDESRLMMVNQVTRFKKVIVPDLSVCLGAYYTPEYKNLFDTVIRNAGATFTQEKKIYCSRSRIPSASGKEQRESDIEEVFRNNGYESVYMEELSLKEQIRLLNSCAEIAMLSGTLAHNLVFVRNSARATVVNKTYLLNVVQFVVNHMTTADIYYVDAYVALTPITSGVGPFIIRRTREFAAYCRDNGLELGSLQVNDRLSLEEILRYGRRWWRGNKKNLYKLHKLATLSEVGISEWAILRYFLRQQLLRKPGGKI